MKILYKKFLIASCISITTLVAFSQTGIYTFTSNNTDLPNAKTLGIIENSSNQVILLNICSNANYKKHSIQMVEINNLGEKIYDAEINIPNLHELIKIENYSFNKLAVFGNTSLNKTYNPFQILINNKGEIVTNNTLHQVYSTLVSDIIVNDNNFMLLYSKVGKNDLYNISLHKISKNDGSVIWLRKISSENNEEADNIVATEQGNFYILGKKYNDEVTEFIPIIYYVNSNGEQLWKKALDIPSNFNSQSLIIDKNDLIYICSYTKSQTGFSETKIYKLSETGEVMHSNSLPDFSSNGIITINSELYLTYGSQFVVDKKQVVTKGKYVLVNKQLSDVFKKTLDKNDKPDAGMNWNTKSSSDFTCATTLSNGKVAIGGKVFMPTNNTGEKFNSSLLMIINKDGTY